MRNEKMEWKQVKEDLQQYSTLMYFNEWIQREHFRFYTVLSYSPDTAVLFQMQSICKKERETSCSE